MFETKASELESSIGFFIVSYKEQINNVRIISLKNDGKIVKNQFFNSERY